MKALQFQYSLPRYAYARLAGKLNPKAFYGPRSCIAYVDIPEPELRGPRWVKLRSILSGFCGTDLGTIALHTSTTTTPFTSFPFVFGHENYSLVHEVGSQVEGVEPGDRVTIVPPPGCEVREIEPPCEPCSRGNTSICENFAEGNLSAGTNIGFCRDTGGGWSKYYLAHDSQVVKIPDSLTDWQAVTLEPLSVALHSVMRAMPEEGQNVLVIGCGVLGLAVIASIRALGVNCHITGVEPSELNAEKAKEKGADVVINPRSEDIYERTVEITGARLYKPLLEERICMGGYERIYDCVGSTETLDDSFRLAAGEGVVSQIGIQVTEKMDWTPVWMKGLRVIGNLGYGVEEFEGKKMHTFEVAMELIEKGEVDVQDLVTHVFKLGEYKKAIEVNMNKEKYNAIKTVFDLRQE